MNKPIPAVTVVVPVYNSAASLARAIRSVLEQTFSDFEVLIVDDGSTDDSLAVATSLASAARSAGDFRIEVISLPQNVGKSRAMNHAATVARGTWIAILDADDRYASTRLATMVEAGEAHDVDLVADNQLHVDHATGQVFRRAFNVPGPGRLIGTADFIVHSDTAGGFDFGILKPLVRSAFMRRHALAYHPGAKLAEDYYFLLEFFAAGGRGWLVHEPLYEWTLPFSPSARRWTGTGSGAWRYDYRNALQTNQHFQTRLQNSGAPELLALLQRRDREYRVMINYIDAQRVLAETGSRSRALAMIASHPGTWPVLLRRVIGRVVRAFPRPFRAAGAGG